MKMKNIFVTLAGLALLGGASIGLANGQKTMKAEAAISETTLYVDYSGALWGDTAISNVKAQIWGGAHGDVYFYSGGSGWSTIEVNSKNYVVLDMTGNQDFTGMQVYAWDYSGDGNISVSISPSSFSDGKNLIIVGNSGSWSTKQPVTFGTLDVGTTYTVTKHGICDGNKGESWVIGSDIVESGGSYAVPARANLSGYHFGGWYTDDDCTVAYTASTIDADLDLYAKYTSLSKDSYIYYITDSSSATTNSIHSWGGDFELDGLITSVSGVQEVHGVTRFRNTNYLIYKIPFSSEAGDTAFKFHYNNWAQESSEKTLVAGNAYQWGVGEIETDETAGGDALDFIFQLEAIRNAVTASGDIKAYSVCGISKANAQTLVSAYTGLSATAKSYVDASYTYTYKPTDDSQNDNVTFAAIMVEITAIANKPDSAHSMDISDTNNSLIIVVVSTLSLVAISSFVLLRKKRNSK